MKLAPVLQMRPVWLVLDGAQSVSRLQAPATAVSLEKGEHETHSACYGEQLLPRSGSLLESRERANGPNRVRQHAPLQHNTQPCAAQQRPRSPGMQHGSPSRRAAGPPRRPLDVQKSRGMPALAAPTIPAPTAAVLLPGGAVELAGAATLLPAVALAAGAVALAAGVVALAPPWAGTAQLNAAEQKPSRRHSAAGRRASAAARLPAISAVAAVQACSGKEALFRHQGRNAKDAANESLLPLTPKGRACGRVWCGVDQ